MFPPFSCFLYLFYHRQLLPDALQILEVDLRNDNLFCWACAGKHFSPGVHDHRVAEGYVACAGITCWGRADHVNLVVYGAGAQQQLPVRRAGDHVEGCGDHDDLRAPLHHFTKKRREPDVKADSHAERSPGGRHHRGAPAGAECSGFPEGEAARQIHVEEVDLPVAGQHLPLRVEDKGGVIQPFPFPLGNAAADDVDPFLPCCPTEHFHRRAARIAFGILWEEPCFVGADEHLREDREPGTLSRRAAEEIPGTA